MLCLRGAGSSIAHVLAALLSEKEEIKVLARDEALEFKAERYVFFQGLLQPKQMMEQTPEEIKESFWVNAGWIIRECDALLAYNPKARICVLGSESGFKWSFDGAYAAAKAALHRYVEAKKLPSSQQQLVCVAPSIIFNTGMTARRTDFANLKKLQAEHPKGRFLAASEVAAMIYFLLYVDRGYTTNTVIRMNGGQHL